MDKSNATEDFCSKFLKGALLNLAVKKADVFGSNHVAHFVHLEGYDEPTIEVKWGSNLQFKHYVDIDELIEEVVNSVFKEV